MLPAARLSAAAGKQDAAKISAYITEQMQKRIMVIDGAMGTTIQQYKFSEADFRGMRLHHLRMLFCLVGRPFAEALLRLTDTLVRTCDSALLPELGTYSLTVPSSLGPP